MYRAPRNVNDRETEPKALSTENICSNPSVNCLFSLVICIHIHERTVVRFLRIDPMVSGSNPPLAKLSPRVRRVTSSLYFQAYESRGVVTSRGRTRALLDKQKASQCFLALCKNPTFTYKLENKCRSLDYPVAFSLKNSTDA